MMPGLLALTAAAIFTGAAFYVRVAEQPARLLLKDDALLIEWKTSYRRGAAMQAPLALVGFFLGLLAWWLSSHPGFLMGAVLMLAPWPWTLLAIRPTNEALLETEPEQAGALTRMLIVRWGTLHSVRTAMGTLATAAYLWACASH
jgi:anthrone oxygenase-like protein